MSRPGQVSGALLRVAVGLALGALAGFYVLRGTDLPAVWKLLRQAMPGWIGLSLVLVAVTQLVKVVRWQAIAGGSHSLSSEQATRGLLVGQALNLLMPFRVGDFARAYLVGRQLVAGSVFTFYTVVVEKALDAAMLLASLAVLLSWGPWPDWLSRPGMWMGLLTLAAVALVLTAAVLWRRRRGAWPATLAHSGLLSRLGERLLAPAARLAEGLAAARHDGRLLWMGLWSVVIWGLGAATNLAVLAALGVAVNWSAAVLILAAIYAGVVVPAPPARVGVWHLLVVLALTAYGVDQSQAMACGVLLHLVVVVPLLVAGGVAALIGRA